MTSCNNTAIAAKTRVLRKPTPMIGSGAGRRVVEADENPLDPLVRPALDMERHDENVDDRDDHQEKDDEHGRRQRRVAPAAAKPLSERGR